MRVLLVALWDRLHPFTPRDWTEARLARIAADLAPRLAAPIFAPLRGRILEIRIGSDGLPTADPTSDSSSHLRAALQALLAETLAPDRLPPRTVRAWISVPNAQDAITYLHAADARGRHRVGWSDGGLGLFPRSWDLQTPEPPRCSLSSSSLSSSPPSPRSSLRFPGRSGMESAVSTSRSVRKTRPSAIGCT